MTPATKTIVKSSSSINHLGRYPKFLKLKSKLISVRIEKNSDFLFFLVLLLNCIYILWNVKIEKKKFLSTTQYEFYTRD